MTKTRQEVENLKSQWSMDPIWNIEDTEGFENYKDELKEFHKNMVQEWARRDREKIKNFALDLGFPDNLALARYLTKLDKMFSDLSYYCNDLQDQINELADALNRDQ